VFVGALEDGGKVLGPVVDGGAELTRRQLDALTDQAKARGAKGLAWVAVEPDGLRSPLDRFFSDAERDGLRRVTGAGPGDLLLIAADRAQLAQTVLGDLRVRLAAERGLVPEGRWEFVWSPSSRCSSGTSRRAAGIPPTTPSLRRPPSGPRPSPRRRLEIDEAEAEERFGFFLRGLEFGAPPHGGFAFGLDRLYMLAAGAGSIRDVITFPKTQSGADPLTGAPTPVPAEQLAEVRLRPLPPPEGPGKRG
jgi:aspartyl-tRNA synthetase